MKHKRFTYIGGGGALHSAAAAPGGAPSDCNWPIQCVLTQAYAWCNFESSIHTGPQLICGDRTGLFLPANLCRRIVANWKNLRRLF